MPSKLNIDLRADLRFFAFFLFNGTVDLRIVDTDYSRIFKEPSVMELIFAIWSNNIDVDETGKPIPESVGRAQRRVAQYIRRFIDSSYVVDPPFEDWEDELHGP